MIGRVLVYTETEVMSYLSKVQLMQKLNMDPDSAEATAVWRSLVLNREAGLPLQQCLAVKIMLDIVADSSLIQYV
jgi:hypothetical protein